jgi:hypothetical protein
MYKVTGGNPFESRLRDTGAYTAHGDQNDDAIWAHTAYGCQYIKAVCYPESLKFQTAATLWGCEHESDGIKEYKSLSMSHDDLIVSTSGFHVWKIHF